MTVKKEINDMLESGMPGWDWNSTTEEIIQIFINKINELIGREDLKEPEDEIDFILLEARFRALEEVLELLEK